MKTNSIGVLLIAGLAVLSAMVVFAGTAAACQCQGLMFYGTITDANDNPYVGHDVEIEKCEDATCRDATSMGTDGTNDKGYYVIWKEYDSEKNSFYRMLIDGIPVDKRYIDDWTSVSGGGCGCCGCCCSNKWSFYRWDYQIPNSRASRYQ